MRSAKLILLLLSLTICWGCTARWHFEPSKDERPVSMFNGRYNIKLKGVRASHHSSISRFFCTIDPIESMFDTLTTNLDTIPIFVMDSLCFIGDCLYPEFCRRPNFIIEDYIVMNDDATVHLLELSTKQYPRWKRRLVWPGNLFLGDNVRIPLECKGNEVFVLLYARLVDRISGKTISKEVKSVTFEVRMHKVIYTSG